MSNKEVSLRDKNIVLIGFMGAGKTTIGKHTAKVLGRDFIDIDDEIEKEFNMSTSQIFNTYGESAFREKEKSMIKHFCSQKLKVLSLGGGAFLQDEIKKTCLSECVVVFLDLSWESWKERISLIIETRPVLQGKNIEEMKELFYKRQGIYASHHIKVKTDFLSIEEAANYIIESVKLD